MLRLIFSAMATLTLLFVGALWLSSQPSGGELRDVLAPLLGRGLELTRDAGRRAEAASLAPETAGESTRVELKPTASGVWEPEAQREVVAEPVPDSETAVEAATRPPAGEEEPPEEIALVPPEEVALVPPEEIVLVPPEEIVLVPPALRPFVEGPLEGRAPELADAEAPVAAASAAPARDGGAAARPDQDEWAALIRRMLIVHSRVSGRE